MIKSVKIIEKRRIIMAVNDVDMNNFEEDTQHGRFLTFSLEEEVFGIEIKYVTEIVGIQSITKVPEVPAYIKGIINLRGKIIPVIDVRLKFGKQPMVYDDRTCIVVIDITEVSVGLIVDNVDEVLTIDDSNIAAPPANKTGPARPVAPRYQSLAFSIHRWTSCAASLVLAPIALRLWTRSEILARRSRLHGEAPKRGSGRFVRPP
jgi:purine-binding chemotaxis protein CheW